MQRASMLKWIGIITVLTGVSLTGINIYGLFHTIRPAVFFSDELRFKDDITLTLQQTEQAINRKKNESPQQYASRITKVIASGIAHIKWDDYDSRRFNQLVPIWDNYFLYFMGKYSGIPEFQRYHFANYQRSINRGIGICGDASMIMSQLLDKQNIKNQIITFPGHVILAAKFADGSEKSYDPDFGVIIDKSPEELKINHKSIGKLYTAAGYTANDQRIMSRIYNNHFERWNGVKHFITNKYYFEKITYLLKWPLPLLLIFIGLFKSIKIEIQKRRIKKGKQ
ncbi:MAG: hypothetical protein COB35_10810 [Gammaproteobacteria bacterium]|nr:MAG: hypothetical protein COB35_10810 [Gammaproteobacteria bacterium]